MFLRERFPSGALTGPADAELADTPLGEALRELLAGPSSGLPPHGWRLLQRTERVAIFGAGELASGMELVRFELLRDRWTPAGADRFVKRLEIAACSRSRQGAVAHFVKFRR